MKLISIITLSLNADKTLGRTIQSVKAQKSDEVEFIIVDGGSTDGTLELIHQNSETIDRLIEGVKGISESMNAGINAAEGEWIMFLHADDWLLPNAIAQSTPILKASEPGVICGIQEFHSAYGTYAIVPKPDGLKREMTVNHIGTFVHKSIHADHGGYLPEYRYAMDFEMFHRLFVRGVPFKVMDIRIAAMSDGGASDDQWKLALKEVRDAKLKSQEGLKPDLDYYIMLIRMKTRRILERSGLRSIVSLYRKYFAYVRKV